MVTRFKNLVGPNVRRLRVRAGLTQDQLAARLQMAGLEAADRVVVAKIESQIRSLFDYELIILARVLKVDASELLIVPYNSVRESLPALLKGERTRSAKKNDSRD